MANRIYLMDSFTNLKLTHIRTVFWLLMFAFGTCSLETGSNSTACSETSVLFSCNQTDSAGTCINITEYTMSFNQANLSADSLGFVDNIENVSTVKSKSFLQPIDGTRCYGVDDTKCCSPDPCVNPNPCLNGACQTLDDGPKLFECNCTFGFSGEWCEVPEMCGKVKCDVNAECRDKKCFCKEGFQGEGTSCTVVCKAVSFYNIDKYEGCQGIERLDFDTILEDQRQYSNQHCSGSKPRPMANVDCKTVLKDGKNVTEFDISSLMCLSCEATLDNVVISKEESKNLTASEIKEYAAKLQILTQPKDKDVENVISVVDSLDVLSETLVHQTEIDIPTLKDVILVVNHIEKDIRVAETTDDINKDDLEPKVKPSQKDESIRTQTQKTLKIIDNFARAVNLTEKTEIEIVTKRMTVTISEPPENATKLIYEPMGYLPESDAMIEDLGKPNSELQVAKKQTIKMTIPQDALAEMRRRALASGDTNMRMVLVLHQDASLLTVDKRTGKVVQASYKSGEGGLEPPGYLGAVFTLEFKKPQTKTPKQTEMLKDTNSRIVETYFCVFWDYRAKDWATEGCEFHGENGQYICECGHFTSFALLLRITKVLKNYAPNYFSIFACSVSVVCLLITIIIYLAVRDLRVRRPTPIMVNICLNLMIGFLFFLIGMDGRNKNFSDEACYVSAVIMHISFLCSWFWMLIYSLNMYYALVKVVGASPLVAKKAFMYTLGYGAPVLIVIIDLIVSLEMDKTLGGINDSGFEASYIATHICWVRHLSMYLAFTAPVGVILFVNIILFFVIIRKLTWKRREIQSSKEKANLSQQLFMAITMMSMMGLTWIFGYLMLVWDDPIFQNILDVLFNIFNTGQGIVIFLMSCVRQKAVRVLWTEPIRKLFGCSHKHKKPKGAKSLHSETSNALSGDTGVTTISRPSKDMSSTTAL